MDRPPRGMIYCSEIFHSPHARDLPTGGRPSFSPEDSMSDLPEDQVAAITLNVETADGDEIIAVPIRDPANAERVMDLMAAIDDVMVDIDPEVQDAVMAAMILAMGNALRQAPDWPIKARLDSFGRFLQQVIEDTKAHLPD